MQTTTEGTGEKVLREFNESTLDDVGPWTVSILLPHVRFYSKGGSLPHIRFYSKGVRLIMSQVKFP